MLLFLQFANDLNHSFENECIRPGHSDVISILSKMFQLPPKQKSLFLKMGFIALGNVAAFLEQLNLVVESHSPKNVTGFQPQVGGGEDWSVLQKTEVTAAVESGLETVMDQLGIRRKESACLSSKLGCYLSLSLHSGVELDFCLQILFYSNCGTAPGSTCFGKAKVHGFVGFYYLLWKTEYFLFSPVSYQ